MTDDEKLKTCIIASTEFRQVNCMVGGQPVMIKIQQKFYNFMETAFVWRDFESIYCDYDKFSQKVSFK